MTITDLRLDSNDRVKRIIEAVGKAEPAHPTALGNPFVGMAQSLENERALGWMALNMIINNRLGATMTTARRTSGPIKAVEKLGLGHIVALNGEQYFMQPTEQLLNRLEKRFFFSDNKSVENVSPRDPEQKVFSLRRFLSLGAA